MNSLILQTKQDIPFVEAQVNIHQPTIKEISLIGEDNFRLGVALLDFNRFTVINSQEDETVLDAYSDFEILMMVLKEQNEVRQPVEFVLNLLFPEYKIKIEDAEIVLFGPQGISRINNFNYENFREIIVEMFCLKTKQAEGTYNPSDGLAGKIAKKLQERQKKLAAQKNKEAGKSTSLFAQYLSILAVGEQKDINQLAEYSVYQIYDEFDRYQLKLDNDMYFQAKVAGATGMDEVDNWMKDLHS